jgi:hypothetical protein
MNQNPGAPSPVSPVSTPEITASYEPRVLPLKNTPYERALSEDDYIPEDVDSVEKISWKQHDEVSNKYVVRVEIAALDYLLRLSGGEGKQYSLAFKTVNYGFSLTNLDEESTKVLFERIADFLETVHTESKGYISEISISPTDTYSTVEDIEDCISEILLHSKKYTEKELGEQYKDFKIFRLYMTLFEKDFEFEKMKHGKISKAYSRSRYFRIKFKQYLKNWEVTDGYPSSISYLLTRRNTIEK